MLASAAAVGQPPTGGVPGLVGLILLELVGGLAVGGRARLDRGADACAGSPCRPPASTRSPRWSGRSSRTAARPCCTLSGFAAVYVAALLLGNAQLPHRVATRSFVEGIGWIAQIGLFVMLGLLASPGRIDLHGSLVTAWPPACS